MILTAHQPVYLPWLGLFHKIALADRFVSFNRVQYQPKDWNNRNRIKTPKGLQWLSVPVRRKGYLEKTIADIEINNTQPWGRKHWNALCHNYAKAPFFNRYADFFEDVYSRQWGKLVDLNEHMLRWFLSELDLDVIVESAGDFDFKGTKGDLVLDMCKQLDADVYIFGAQGRNYANPQVFMDAGVKSVFQDYRHPEHPQLHGPFESHLSIVDLMFNCGDDSLDILMSGNIERDSILRPDVQVTAHRHDRKDAYNMSQNSPGETLYAAERHQSVWPWSDLVSLVMQHVAPAHENGFRVLDLGCGMGANVPFFLALDAEYFGIDISKTAITRLQERFADIADKFAVGDFTREVPFEGPFDLVVDQGSLTHNTSDAIRQCIALIEERMRPGAVLVGIHWFSTESSDFTKGEPTQDSYCRTNFTDGSFADTGIVHFTDEAHLRDLLAGFELISLHHTLTNYVVPGDGARTAFWNFVARRP